MRQSKINFISGLIIISILIVVPAAAKALEFGVRGYYSYAALTGDLRVDSAGVTGTELNIKDRLGLGHVYYPSVEAFLGVGRHNLSLKYSQYDSSASTMVTNVITFKGTNFLIGSALQTDIKLKTVDLDYQYDFLQARTILAGLSLGLIGKLKYLEGEAQLKSATLTAKETFQIAVPMIGLGVRAGLLANILEARARLTGMGYGDNMIYEGLADVSLTPFPFLDIHLGYKVSGINVKITDFNLKANFSGPYAAITIGF